MRLRSVADVERVLAKHVGIAARTTGKDITAERTLRLASLAGNPEKSLRAVHVAGTSGKTSTCYYMAAMLRQAGKKVGLTVSPHVDRLTERVQINGQPLADDVFCSYFESFYEMVEAAEEPPTYFELMIVFALWVFRQERVEYAVLETGMGGLHDSTNIVSSEDKLCIITDIGMDHMHVLGTTVESIARQKAGIIWPGNHAIMYRQEPDVMAVIERWAADHDASLDVIANEWVSAETGLPEFQRRNWELAYQAYGWLAERDMLPELTEKQQQASRETYVPGRMEVVDAGGLAVILDGAHNEQKMSTFFDSFAKQFPGVRPVVLMALKQGKEIKTIAPLIVATASSVIVTEFRVSQDSPITSMSAADIAQEINTIRPGLAEVAPSLEAAWREAVGQQTGHILVIGSFYLVGEVRRLLDAA